ncbi:MAG: alpha/beta fold hydrolase [Hyphomicrobium sp.]
MFEGFDCRRVTCGDVDIAAVIGGSGPPVLLLHGYPQTHAMWGVIAPMLAKRYTVVAADLRGYGDSSKPVSAPDHSNYSFRAMANDQVALMRQLGFARFHLIGHDRGGRTAHRMALDHPDVVQTLAMLDIVPTYAMFMETTRLVSGAYWHWYFLSQPAPFPDHMIALDPDFFFETCLVGWGKTALENFNPWQLAQYRRAWRDPAMIHGSCSDYRAAATIDLVHDEADLAKKVACPTLAFWGSSGLMGQLFDLKAEWAKRVANLETATLAGGHFFPDHAPRDTADILLAFLDSHAPLVSGAASGATA